MKYIEFESKYGIFSTKNIQWIYIPGDNLDSVVIDYFNNRQLVINCGNQDSACEFYHKLSNEIDGQGKVEISDDEVIEFYMDKIQ